MIGRLQKSMKDRDKGFTLIELLVVIVIIGILAAIAIPLFLNQRKKGVDASLKSDLKGAATAAETVATDLPSNTDFDPDGAGPKTIKIGLTDAGFKPSPNNTVEIAGGPAGGYCVRAFNSGASSATTSGTALMYDSKAGGLSGTTCSLAGTPTWTAIS